MGKWKRFQRKADLTSILLRIKSKKTEKIENEIDGIEESSKNIFHDCELFINSKRFTFPPTQLMLIYSNEDYTN